MKRPFALLLLLVAWPGSAQEEERPWRTEEVISRLRAYQKVLGARRDEVQRKVSVLAALGEAADDISPASQTPTFNRARRKLAEAEGIAAAEPPLAEPVPTVLQSFRAVLSGPGFAFNTPKMRAEAFRVLAPLEEHVLIEADALYRESAAFQSLEGIAGQTQIGLRSMVATALRATIQSRHLALK